MSIKLRGGNQLMDAVEVLTRGGIKEGAVVADLGCGTTGHFVFPAAHLVGPKGKVYAVDLLSSVLAAIESRKKFEGVDNVESVRADLDRTGGLKIDADSVDLVLLVNIIGQVQEKKSPFREAARIIKSGGMLVVSDWKKTASPLGPPEEKRINPADAGEWAVQAGFEFVSEFEAGPYHFGMVFKKK